MPNPGKNLNELQETGTLRKHPSRYRSRVAAVEGYVPLGCPPAHLNDQERDAWDEIRQRAQAGSLAEGDFMLVELAARLLVKSRSDWENFTATDARVLQSIAGDLGMSPIKRGKVSLAKKEKPESTFTELARLLSGKDRMLGGRVQTDA